MRFTMILVLVIALAIVVFSTPTPPATIFIAVHVHIIAAKTDLAVVSVNDTLQEIQIVNNIFIRTKVPFELFLASFEVTVNDKWSLLLPGTRDSGDMKRSLHVGDMQSLNLYIVRLRGNYLGWSSMPGSELWDDGIVIDKSTMPSGTLYINGGVLAHELGHWFSLKHIYGGCPNYMGTYVFGCESEFTSGQISQMKIAAKNRGFR